MSDKPLFVYPEHSSHKPYREIARNAPMVIRGQGISYSFRGMDLDPRLVLGEKFDEIEWLSKNQEKMQEQLRAHFTYVDRNDINLCSSTVKCRGIRPCGIRLSPRGCGWYPTAFEPLAFGIGLLRNYRTEQTTPFELLMGTIPLPKISSRKMNISRYYTKRSQKRACGVESDYPLHVYEATNLICADSYGELEQLWARRDEKEFLEIYLLDLQESTKFRKYLSIKDEIPEGMCRSDSETCEVWKENIVDGLWAQAPRSTLDLLERVEFLLDNTFIDTNPIEELTDYVHHDDWEMYSRPRLELHSSD